MADNYHYSTYLYIISLGSAITLELAITLEKTIKNLTANARRIAGKLSGHIGTHKDQFAQCSRGQPVKSGSGSHSEGANYNFTNYISTYLYAVNFTIVIR